MADSASEMESDTSSVDGASVDPRNPDSLVKRVESLSQENRVLRMEIETLKLKNKTLQEENKDLRRASVNIQAKAEQEEEYISNTLLKKISSLKKEKEMLAVNYEHEEEFLTNDLTRQLNQLKSEKVHLERTLEQEQEAQVNKLLKRIEKLEAEIRTKQVTLEQLRHEKVELENSLEQEQEALVNRLWKRMDKLEVEKRMLQERLDQPVSAPPSPRTGDNRDVSQLTQNIITLRGEVTNYRRLLKKTQTENAEKMAKLVEEERHMKEENLRLHRKLQLEMERREALCRHLSESESSLEMDDERHFNELAKYQDGGREPGRARTVSSPIPHQGTPAKPITPSTLDKMDIGGTTSPPHPLRCNSCGQMYGGVLHPNVHSTPMPPPATMSSSLPSMSPPNPNFFLPPTHPSHLPTAHQSISQTASAHNIGHSSAPSQRPKSRTEDRFVKPHAK